MSDRRRCGLLIPSVADSKSDFAASFSLRVQIRSSLAASRRSSHCALLLLWLLLLCVSSC